MGTLCKNAPGGGISYVHNNPVAAGLVYKAYDYVYSSASDYADEKGLLDGIEYIAIMVESERNAMQSRTSEETRYNRQ